MKLYSTNSPDQFVSLKAAVLKGLPEDNGLFMPCRIERLGDSFFNQLESLSFADSSYVVARHLIRGAIPEEALNRVVYEAINFPAPLVNLNQEIAVLELFHGPTLSFKDFGARFMARLIGYFNEEEKDKLYILVATSGDTGSAVASGFYGVPGIEVVILYPSEKVSKVQEQQLTTLGKNIKAIEIKGTFDDCQKLVKQAFLDTDVTDKIRLSSANSINIARLIPQTFYYFEAYKQLKNKEKGFAFVVPSGNFGNLTAGIFAKLMGIPVNIFIAATNQNDIVPSYLDSGDFKPKPSIKTISNAMDVGDPSNFKRLLDIFKDESSTWNNMRETIKGLRYTDDQTLVAMREIFDLYGYQMDPHGAVAYLAFKQYSNYQPGLQGILLETAHPAKFAGSVKTAIGKEVELPPALEAVVSKQKESILMDANFEQFKSWLLQ